MKFTMDSPVFRFLGTMTDFIMLNVVFLFTCLPVFTIGPAVCALFSITMREAREEHGYLIRPYLQAFKANFKSAFQLFMIYAAVGAVLLFNVVFWMKMETAAGSAVFFILMFCSVVYLLSLCYGFALNARFANTVKQTFKNSVLIALSEMKYSVVLLAILLLTVFLYCLWDVWRVFLMTFGFAFLFYCQSYIFIKIFAKYESKERDALIPENNYSERISGYGKNELFKESND